ncbi:MAG: roadblock/LC7 domain-containing protein [Nitrospiraceae bacterium]|nr:roadblock/LC7 domain-containing protein [Nitrospiraceae bacterium]
MLDKILNDLIASVPGASAAIFLDGEGESIVHAGDTTLDIKLLGAWKEIHLDRIREIAGHIGIGEVHAVLFSLNDGNELLAPVSNDYCILLFLSPYSDLQKALGELKKTIALLLKEIE